MAITLDRDDVQRIMEGIQALRTIENAAKLPPDNWAFATIARIRMETMVECWLVDAQITVADNIPAAIMEVASC